MGVEPSKMSLGSVPAKQASSTKRKLRVPPPQACNPTKVTSGSLRSSDVVVTTSNVPPVGSELLSQKDPIWVAASQTEKKAVTWTHDGQKTGDTLSNLMDVAKNALIKQAQSVGCNAVLGMTFNVSHSSAGQRGSKEVSVTMMGTPCVISGPSSRKKFPISFTGGAPASSPGRDSNHLVDECFVHEKQLSEQSTASLQSNDSEDSTVSGASSTGEQGHIGTTKQEERMMCRY